ncbi:hypothetical protein FRB95_002269 [Tulasnella sp. JGI-2019a]|nr:hypothetical protein FRB95_002269 [Tulasnella sp. JGI-2019a]
MAKPSPSKRVRKDSNTHRFTGSGSGRSHHDVHQTNGSNSKPRSNFRKAFKTPGTASNTTTQGGAKKSYKERQNDRKPKAARASLRQFAWLISAKKARHDAKEREQQQHAQQQKRQGYARTQDDVYAPTTVIADSERELSTLFPGSPPRTFKIIAGSYEKLLYGLEGTFPPFSPTTLPGSSRPIPTLKPIFIFPAHVGCVKAAAASPTGGKWLATSSTDEIIKVWDLRRKKEVGALVHHSGSVTQLTFPSPSHLLSASEDGTLALFSTRDWIALRTFKGHKGRINCVAVHPSGKLALSVGKDRTIRMWDFMRGKASLSTKIGKEAELVRWAPSGALFTVQSHSSVDVYTTNMALIHTINHPARIQDVKFISRVNDPSSEVLLVSGEDKKVSVYDPVADDSPPTSELKKSKSKVTLSPKLNATGGAPRVEEEAGGDVADADNTDDEEDSDEDEAHIAYRLVAEFVGHESRVKAMDTLQVSLPTSPQAPPLITTYLTTISSDGKIHVYDCADIPAAEGIPTSASSPTEVKTIHPIAKYDTKGSRLTCVAFADGEVPLHVNGLVGKRKRNATEGNEDSEGDDDDDDHDDASAEGDASASEEASDEEHGSEGPEVEGEEDMEEEANGWGGLA